MYSSSLREFKGYDRAPQAGEEGEVDDGEEDFYTHSSVSNAFTAGLDATSGPQGNINGSLMQSTPSSEQAENIKKAELLRAKLIAKRQNTPMRAHTPMKQQNSNSVVKKQEDPQFQASGPETKTMKLLTTDSRASPSMNVRRSTPDVQNSPPSSDIFGLESLLAEGKAAAEAKMKQQNAQTALETEQADEQPAAAIQNHLQKTHRGDAIASSNKRHTVVDGMEKTDSSHREDGVTAQLTDAYYSDLSIWLEVTGYHDVEYRTSKLRTYKERKALEQEAARIADRLEKLKKDEQTEIQSIRASPMHLTANSNPPILPTHMPASSNVINQNQMTHSNNQPATSTFSSVKRARSPEPTEFKSARVRGTNGNSPDSRFTTDRRPSPSPGGLERRISYPDARRQSNDPRNNHTQGGRQSRDPSLERRLQYYNPEHSSTVPSHERNGRDSRYERDAGGKRLGYSSVHLPSTQDTTPGRPIRGYRDEHRGSSGLDLRRGGVRYFMIKSWNHENVQNAMRDCLWATQVKNENVLTEAFQRSRFVVLLFSVNKSTAFQGYALMTSPPTPSLPKPAFCTKLNWDTSPAFKLQWLATTPVHFKFVGHLKNEFNLDEQGVPMAVLVGKDGQEISSEAGMGVVGVLDDVEEQERRARLGA